MTTNSALTEKSIPTPTQRSLRSRVSAGRRLTQASLSEHRNKAFIANLTERIKEHAAEIEGLQLERRLNRRQLEVRCLLFVVRSCGACRMLLCDVGQTCAVCRVLSRFLLSIFPAPLTLTHPHTHALKLARTQTRKHSRTHALTHSNTHTLTHSNTHTHSNTQTRTHAHTQNTDPSNSDGSRTRSSCLGACAMRPRCSSTSSSTPSSKVAAVSNPPFHFQTPIFAPSSSHFQTSNPLF
eukprot:1212446-Rhodomonas_salina.2